MYQEWRHLTFLHWAVDPAVIRPLIPRRFEVDLFDGKAWVGLVPFFIQVSRFTGIPWTIQFPETNARTYVRAPDGQTGVWFFSLDAASMPAVIGARLGFALPYELASMSFERAGQRIHYQSQRVRTKKPASCDVTVDVGEALPDVKIGPLEVFLINRYRLYSPLAYGDVDHAPYPLSRVTLIECRQTLFDLAGPPDAVHFSPGVDVRIGRPHFA